MSFQHLYNLLLRAHITCRSDLMSRILLSFSLCLWCGDLLWFYSNVRFAAPTQWPGMWPMWVWSNGWDRLFSVFTVFRWQHIRSPAATWCHQWNLGILYNVTSATFFFGFYQNIIVLIEVAFLSTWYNFSLGFINLH